jgi:hypothetical protein
VHTPPTPPQLNLQFNKISPAVKKCVEQAWVKTGRVRWKLLFNERQLSNREREHLLRLAMQKT